MTGWSLAIDFGTTATTAVIIRGTGMTPVRFGVTTRMPSGVFVDDDEGFVAGTPGANRGGADPGRYVRTPKRHVGRDDTVVVAGREIPVTDLVATVLATTATQAAEQAGGGHPDTIVLTHPARWGTDAREVLTAAAKGAGLGDVLLVPEPVAAGHGGATDAADGALLAVYDLGGGTFDAVVLRKSDATTWSIEGSPGGIDPFGGESFDSILHRYVIEKVSALDADTAARLQQPTTAAERGLARTWWRDLRAMKEDLSETSSSQIAVPGSDHAILVSRDELENLLTTPISQSVAELERTIASGKGAQPATILLCGDASRMPLVHRLVQEGFPGLDIATATDPKGVVALGAHAAAGAAPAPVADPVVDPVAPAEPVPSPPPAASPAPPAPPPAAPPGVPRIDLDKRPGVPPAGPAGGWQGPPPLPPPMGPNPGDRAVSPPPSGKTSRLLLPILGAAAAVFILLIVGVGLALSSSGGGGGGSGTKTPTAPETPPTGTADAVVADVAAAFDVADDKCTATGDEVKCTSRDAATNTDLTTTFTKYAGAPAAKTGFDDLAAKAKKADTSAWTSAYYATPPTSGARTPAAAGTVLVAYGATQSEPAFRFAATSDKLDSYVVGVEGDEYDATEQKLLSLITDGKTPSAADVFGSTFGLVGYRACQPNLDWFTVVDGSLPDFDCFTTTAGGRAGEIQGWYRKIDTTITDYFTKRKGRSGTTVVKDTTWSNVAQPGVARGPYVILDAGADAPWRYELMWADNAQPGLIASLYGNDVAALEKFWADNSAPRS